MEKKCSFIPVSKKSYAGFIERINSVFPDEVKRRAMLSALDMYLAGDRDTYDRGLTPDCVLAFSMLRFEIDLAIARSAKARMRIRKSRDASAQAECDTNLNKPRTHGLAEIIKMWNEVVEECEAEYADKRKENVKTAEADEEPYATDCFVTSKTRRQRRAECRRKRARWRKL